MDVKVDDLVTAFRLLEGKVGTIFETYGYKGFDANKTLQAIRTEFKNDTEDLLKILVAVEQNGPNKCFTIPHLMALMRAHNIKRKAQEPEDLTPGRILTVCAPLYVLATHKLPRRKRFEQFKVPAALQFPASTSVAVPEKFESEFKKFHVAMHDALQTGKQVKQPFNEQLWEIQRSGVISIPAVDTLVKKLFEEEARI